MAPGGSIVGKKPNATVIGTIVNVVTNGVGAGMLSLPWVMSQATTVPGFLAIALFGALNAGSMLMLADAAMRSEAWTYRELGEIAGGRVLGLVSHFATGAYTLGSCISYIVLLSDWVGPGVEGLSGDKWWAGREARGLVILSVCGLLVALCLFPNLASFQATSGVAVTAIVFSAGVIVYEGFTHDHSGQGFETVHLTPNIFAAFPILIVAYCLHYNAPVYTYELQDRSMAKMTLITCVAFTFCTLMFATLAFSGYYAFGSSTQGDVLNNFSDSSTLATATRLVLAVVIIFTYPLALHPLRTTTLQLMFPNSTTTTTSTSTSTTTPLISQQHPDGRGGFGEDEEDIWGVGRGEVDGGSHGWRRRSLEEKDVGEEEKEKEGEESGDGGGMCSSDVPLCSATSMFVHVVVTVLLVGVTGVVGWAAVHVEEVLAFKGAIFGSSIVYILPGIIYASIRLQDEAGILPTPKDPQRFSEGGRRCLSVLGVVCGRRPPSPLLTSPIYHQAHASLNAPASPSTAPVPPPSFTPTTCLSLASTIPGCLFFIFVIFGIAVMGTGVVESALKIADGTE